MGNMSPFFFFRINVNSALSSAEPLLHGVAVVTFFKSQLGILKEIEPPAQKKKALPTYQKKCM